MNPRERLAYFARHWPTDKGVWIPGRAVRYRERSLFDDFGDRSWMALLIYGVTGREVPEATARLLERVWLLCASYPDPRLWNNRVAALAGTVRAPASLAVAAATAVSDAEVYGARPVHRGMQFLAEVADRRADDRALLAFLRDRLRRERALPGFGRPVISEDERIPVFLAELDRAGLEETDHQRLVVRIRRLLADCGLRLKPNIVAHVAALFLDLGFTPQEGYCLVLLAFSAGILPCYLDALEKEEGMFLPLSCDCIRYVGKPPREWSR
ncbi:MAG: hypothetical protein KatS3mg124_1132 [Porticoccaceae bacterium]|nr:MAG: hypothetical protein KatS3mg124_1132 [Porticoccaceae bacterium]